MEQQLSFKLLAKNKCLYWNLMQNSRRWKRSRALPEHFHICILQSRHILSRQISLCAAKGACVVPMWNAEPRAVRPASRQKIRPEKVTIGMLFHVVLFRRIFPEFYGEFDGRQQETLSPHMGGKKERAASSIPKWRRHDTRSSRIL